MPPARERRRTGRGRPRGPGNDGRRAAHHGRWHSRTPLAVTTQICASTVQQQLLSPDGETRQKPPNGHAPATLQGPEVGPQTPGVPPPPQVCGGAQTVPQAPQFWSAVLLTQAPPQQMAPATQSSLPSHVDRQLFAPQTYRPQAVTTGGGQKPVPPQTAAAVWLPPAQLALRQAVPAPG